MTRSKRLVVLAGQRRALGIAVRVEQTRRRWPKLREWLGGPRRSGAPDGVATVCAPEILELTTCRRPAGTSLGAVVLSKPNLFRFATSELSQDAFICWLLAWANRDSAAHDAALHDAGLIAVNALLRLHDVPAVTAERVVIRQQLKRADVVVEVGDAIVLLIEDKANAAEHGKQLENYLVAIPAEYPGRKVLPIFFKTGDQSDYKAAIRLGYRLFRRKDFLNVLRAGKQQGVSNAVFLDFLDHLEERDRAVEAYAHRSPRDWDHQAWAGFYMRLQEAIPDLQWGYVPNQAGGFMGAWWHFREWEGWDVYLQVEQRDLCLKLQGGGKETGAQTRATMRDRWLAKLQRASQGHRLGIQRPTRFGNGWSMTAGRVEADGWLAAGQDGSVDVERVVSILHEAEAVVDRALATAD